MTSDALIEQIHEQLYIANRLRALELSQVDGYWRQQELDRIEALIEASRS
jgi:hypothetical protein